MSSKKFFNRDNLYIVSVSGGPDSMFLLDNMRKEGSKIVVAHVNYQKRKESSYDENLVRNYCQEHSLSLEVKLIDNSHCLSQRNFQDWARQVRYNFCQELAQKYQTKYIVVAHHQDDHLETYLLQKRRKSLVEYWGLPPRIKQGRYWILRPILALNKKKLEKMEDEERKVLLKEIKEKNRELKKIKLLVNSQRRQLISNSSTLKLEKKDNYPPEIYLRLLYWWINNFTGGILCQRKKKLLNEIYKQLFISPKTNLIINLNKFQIAKCKNYAIIQLKIN